MIKVKLAYRHIIDNTATYQFEKTILQLTYDEFLIKSQAYNEDEKFVTFTQMKANNGKANSLHYKIMFPVSGLMEELHSKIPVLTDNLGKQINFETYRFELIESNINDFSKHKIAIVFSTKELTLLHTIGEYLLLASDEDKDKAESTFLLQVNPNVSITQYAHVNN